MIEAGRTHARIPWAALLALLIGLAGGSWAAAMSVGTYRESILAETARRCVTREEFLQWQVAERERRDNQYRNLLSAIQRRR